MIGPAASSHATAPAQPGWVFGMTYRSDTPGLILTLSTALALSGLAELVLQRVVYRVGVHIPRDGVFLDAYEAATFGGDFSFRLTVVLLAAVTAVLGGWLLASQKSRPAGITLAALGAANLLAWPFGLDAGRTLVPLVFVFGTAWLAGSALGSRRRDALIPATVLAGLTLVLGQYRVGFSDLGLAPAAIAPVQLANEVVLLAAVACVVAAALPAARPRPLLAAVALSLALAGAYFREPATVSIVSLWATGITMSLPAAAYLAAFAGLVAAAFSWGSQRGTRHLAVGLALLLVAGVQPQALHHDLTAFVGLTLLWLGRDAFSAPAAVAREATSNG